MEGVIIKKLDKKVDERGFLIKVLMRNELEHPDFGEIYLTSACPGIIKGNHYHPLTNEWFYLISGQAKLVLENGRGDRREIMLSGQEPAVVKVPAGMHHAVKNIGQTEMSLLAYADNPYDPADTISVDIKF